MRSIDILKKPIITEKSSLSTAKGEYLFQVEPKANKRQIAQAVKAAFGVKVKKVRVLRYASEKRAIVQLAEGEKIAVFETGE